MKAGKWDDVAEASYLSDKEGRAQRADQDKLRRGSVEHDRAFEMLKALPEAVIGEGGFNGVGAGVVSFDALSSYYAPNQLQGSWGGPQRPRGVAAPGSVAGNTIEAFQEHFASGRPVTAMSAYLNNPAAGGTSYHSGMVVESGEETSSAGAYDWHNKESNDLESLTNGRMSRRLDFGNHDLETYGVRALMMGQGFGYQGDKERIASTGHLRTKEEATRLFNGVMNDSYTQKATAAYSNRQDQLATVSASGTSGLTQAIQNLSHSSNGPQVVAVLQQVLQTLQRMEGNSRRPLPAQSAPRNPSLGATVQALGQGLNTNRGW
jgi:hypothetical protein